MNRHGGTDLRRMARTVLHGVFWGAVYGGAGGVAVGTAFVPVIGSVVGGIVGSVTGFCLGALCGLVLAVFFGVHAWLGHDRAAAARDFPVLAVLVVAVTAAVFLLDPHAFGVAELAFGITRMMVVLATVVALPSAWFVARQLGRHTAHEVDPDAGHRTAGGTGHDGAGLGTAAGDPHPPA